MIRKDKLNKKEGLEKASNEVEDAVGIDEIEKDTLKEFGRERSSLNDDYPTCDL